MGAGIEMENYNNNITLCFSLNTTSIEQKVEFESSRLYSPFSDGTDRRQLETFSLKIHFRSERTTAIL
uniref:Uncharacterized protein n=1 Tax=Romanomermis culicivorax TaxID=13658 RepID=A0A915JK59_ROMCU